MISTYQYSVQSTAADGQTWSCDGFVTGELPECASETITSAFQQLTKGKAVFGKPGVSCRGPYKVDTIRLKRVEL